MTENAGGILRGSGTQEPANVVEINDTGRGALCKPSEFVARQQAPRVYEMNASIYVYRPEVFRGEVRVPTRLDFGVFEMRDYGIIDIDTEGDLKMMELLLGSGEDLLAEGLLNLALVAKRARMEVRDDAVQRRLDIAGSRC